MFMFVLDDMFIQSISLEKTRTIHIDYIHINYEY